MEELGEFGFWLAAGMVVAAMIIAGAVKKRDREREREATLRALLDKEGGSTAEVLAYLREKDAAELKFQRQALGLDWGGGTAAGWAGFAICVLAIIAGLISLTYTSPRREFINMLEQGASGTVPRTDLVTTAPLGDFALTPVAVMMAIWAGGFIIAALIWWLFGKKKHGAQPDA